jgi:tetratricopeptide (TPR) repeat protein
MRVMKLELAVWMTRKILCESRIEIGAALHRNIPVIPILLDGAKVPKANQLPKDLEELSMRNGLDVRHTSFHNDIDRVVRSLKGQLSEADAEKRRHDEEERRRQEAEVKQREGEEELRRKAEAEKLRQDEEERRRQEIRQAEARQRAEEERRREEAATKRRLEEAEAEKRRQDKERRKLEKEAAWAAKKERLHRWRGAAAAGAAVVALLIFGGIWLYRTTTPAGVTSAVVQPDVPGAEKAKAVAEAEAKLKVEEAEQQDGNGWIGVRTLALTTKDAERLNIKPPRGVLVTDVADPSPAKSVGIERGDVIVKFDGKDIMLGSNARVGSDVPVGKQVLIVFIQKGGGENAKTVTVGHAPQSVLLLREGNTAAYERDYDKAIAKFGDAIRLDPNYALAFNNRGNAYAKKGDDVRAIADYNEAIRLDPQYVYAFCNRGKAKLRINDASGNADIAKAKELGASVCG